MKPVSTASDLWSLGVVTYVLLSGLMPFSGDDDHQTLVKVAKADWDFDDECFDDLSHDAMEFIEGLLVKEPSERLTIEECFQHSWIKDTHDTGAKINTQNHKAFLAKRRWKKSVNALLAVRRMSLSPLFAAKRRRSMDPKLLKSASECEEEQYNEVDRKTSSPLDPSSLTLPNRRFGETRNSCFDLDMKTIRALQEKADKALAKGSKKEESDGNDENSTHSKQEESDGNDENSMDSKKEESDRDDENSASDDDLDNNTDLSNTRSEETENERRASECAGNVMDRESCSYQRPRANTVCGATSREWKTSPTENTICGGNNVSCEENLADINQRWKCIQK
ncbi:hypothetical protein OS493_010816 [Desmophyllum pertusum]|uniref:Protein kinase domain-containing protein n=1 Tax=Desmophyllum pertusum TaxID=174260 RepID=A0A9W9ZES4_9CNID|nr:hypothetical protein OS493_010816 [Desmophyllum pertusum]